MPEKKNGLHYLYQWILDALYVPLRLASLFTGPSFRERLGFYPPEAVKDLAWGVNVWLHAASAGEVNAIRPFCGALRGSRPGLRIILTTTSETGKKLALEKGLADAVFLAPLDMTPALKRAFRAFRPAVLLIAETEFWPNWAFRAQQNRVPQLLVNGRISGKSFPSYRRFQALFGPALRCFNQCLVQTAGDRDKLVELGVPEKRVQVAGQMKYDLVPPADEKALEWGREMGIGPEDVLFVFGSLREGEEDLIFPLLPGLLQGHRGLKVLLAPRHVKNAETYVKKLEALGTGASLRGGPGARGARVLVMDRVGELSLAYHLARAAFVGGTLVPVGGHNVMEPALSRVPVLFGPFTENVAEAARALVLSGGGFEVKTAEGIPGLLGGLLDPAGSHIAGEKAFAAVSALRGATEKNLRAVLAYLPGTTA